MMLAARHPDLAGHLMVVDMMPFMGALFGPPGTSADSVRPLADQIRADMLASPPGSGGMLEQMISAMTRTDSMRPVLLRHSKESHVPTVANAFHELIVTDLRPELARITAPMSVLFVTPTAPGVIPEQYEGSLRTWYSTAPKARLTKIEESNHFIQFDQPARLAAEVEALMRR